jgi:hypothetical protein
MLNSSFAVRLWSLANAPSQQPTANDQRLQFQFEDKVERATGLSPV